MKHFSLPFQFIDDEALGQEEGRYIFHFFFVGGGGGGGGWRAFNLFLPKC